MINEKEGRRGSAGGSEAMAGRSRAPNGQYQAAGHPPHHSSFEWKGSGGNFFGAVALGISIISALYTAGWLPGIAKSTDVTALAERIGAIHKGVESLALDLKETKQDVAKVATGVARMEGRIEATTPVITRPLPLQPKRKPAVLTSPHN